MMEWNTLLTPKRLGKNDPNDLKTIRTWFKRDFDRLVFSSSFRRLKDKTQVFSLVKHDYVRTRLIHSIEVSCVGRSLGTIVGKEIVQRHNLENFDPSDFGDIVSAACLAHDIGNPPFGHSGEDAICTAFQAWWNAQKPANQSLSTEEKKDLDKFEGNAQGFRILTRLEMQPRYGGMQLTCPTLAAFMKYPRESYIPEDTLNGYNGKSIAKYGFFQSEKCLFAKVADTVGLIQRNPDYRWWARHPLTFLVEAADDICYCIVDLEDGYRTGYIPFKKTKKLLNSIAQIPKVDEGADSQEEKIKHLRAVAINNLVNEVAQIFLDKEASVLKGTFDCDLLPLSQYVDALTKIKDMTREKVFKDPEVVRI